MIENRFSEAGEDFGLTKLGTFWVEPLGKVNERHRPARREPRLQRHDYGHDAVSRSVEQLSAGRVPHRLGPSFDRDLPFPARSRVRLHAPFVPS
jgi:hypothetical protein